MKEFIPQINIRDDRVYLVLLNHPEGYATLGHVYYMRGTSFVRTPIDKKLNIYPNYNESCETFRQWTLSIYDSYHMTKKDWNTLYEFQTLGEVKRFLNKMKMAKELLK